MSEKEISIGEILSINEAFKELCSLKLPGKVALPLARLARELDTHVKDFHIAREKLMESRGFTIVNGQAIAQRELSPEEITALNLEISEMAKQTVRVSYTQIAASTIQDQSISATSLAQLEWMFD